MKSSATFCGIDLLPEGSPQGGGIFYLLNPASVSGSKRLPDGVSEVEVATGCRAVVVRGIRAESYEEALALANSRAQEGLDLFSVSGAGNLAVADLDTEHLVWWNDGSNTILRFWGAARLTASVPPVTVRVTGPDGKPVPQTPEREIWHESMRYFRQSQVTTDLFDAYRNLFLALESILSTICPVSVGPNGRPSEGEAAWFKRALRESHKRVDLTRFASPETLDPVSVLYSELYRTVRNAVFHAKRGRDTLLPHDTSARSYVADPLERLSGLYLKLVEVETGVGYRSGGIFASFFRQMAEGIGPSRIHLTEDEVPLDASMDKLPFRSGSQHVGAPLRRAPAFDESWLVAYLASISAAELSPLPSLSTLIAATAEEQPAFAFTLEGQLKVTGFDRMEAVVGLRATNANTPRSRFVT